jgi:hypothetical protein
LIKVLDLLGDKRRAKGEELMEGEEGEDLLGEKFQAQWSGDRFISEKRGSGAVACLCRPLAKRENDGERDGTPTVS